jgi:pimeloyl-ACP methyl ester carboxylesterase
VAPSASASPAAPSASAAPPSTPPSTSSAATATASPSVGSLAPVGALAWTDCGAPFECATLKVPLDYAKPAGTQISIALARLPASVPSSRIGSLVINPGGPGGSGIEFLKSAGESLFSQALRDRFDIVSFDPRGVGDSTAVECLDGPELDRLNALDPTPDTPAERDALIAGAKEFDQACETNSGDLLPYMSTVDAARDMDQIRQGLGEAKLTYLGFSYGTFLGTVYAGLFPTNIRAFVLDGAIDPVQTFEQRNEAQAAGFARALNAFLDDCKAHTTCAFYNKGNPADAFDKLMTQIDAKPLPALATGDPRPVGPGEAFTGVLYALYSKSSWPVLAQGLTLAQRGDGSILLLMADAYNERQPDGTYKNVSAANNAVNCLDYTAPTDVAAYDAMVPTLEKVAPRFGAAIAYSGLTCAFWPIHPTRDPGEIRAEGAPPILVVGTTGDPATPYQWAVNLAKELASGVLLTRTGEGHTAYGDSKCIQDNVDQYLLTLKVPAANTTCAS